MRFKPIQTYAKAWSNTLIPENLENLIQDFDIKSWSMINSGPYPITMLEKVFERDNAQPSPYDYGTLEYPVIDHAFICRRYDGVTFILTIPYNTPNYFYKEFNRMIEEYKQEQAEHPSKFKKPPINIHAVLIDKKYKPRTNDTMVGIIAPKETLQLLGLL